MSRRGIDALTVVLTHANTVRDRKPYTIYEIEVRSSSTSTWVVYKRYSDFYALHSELGKLKTSDGSKFKLPTLPPRRLTRSLAAEIVKRRMKELQVYLSGILRTQLRQSELVLAFLEVPDTIRPMLARGADEGAASGASGTGEFDEDSDPELSPSRMQHRSFEERKVHELIHKLAKSKTKVAAIQAFEAYFFEVKPRLNSELVSTLLLGNPPAKLGILEACGQFKYSHVACRAALDLLCRLIDVEQNKDAGFFLETMTQIDIGQLEKMKLHLHILSERGNRLGAFNIISTLRQRLPRLSMERLVPDTWARQQYYLFEQNDQTSNAAPSEPTEAVGPASLADTSYAKLAEDAFQEVYSIAHMETGWTVVKPFCGSAHPNEPLGDTTDLPGTLRVTYKSDSRSGLTVVRVGPVLLPGSVEAVTRLLIDFSRRREWDVTFHRGQRLQKLEKTTDVVKYVFSSAASPYKYRELCLLRSWTKLESGARLLVTRSVTHDAAPEGKHNVRGILAPSGYVITKAKDVGDDGSSCLLTMVTQADREAVMIISPDLLGETTQMAQSLANMKDLLEMRERG